MSTSRPLPYTAARWIYGVLGSVGLACVILVLLGLLTFLGTLEQTHKSLYDVQRQYFESYVHVYSWRVTDAFTIPVPLLGANLLLTLLAFNLLVGGMIRLRKSRRTIGVFVIHIGIAVLLVGSFIEYKWSDKGHMTIYEGEASNEFQSYFEWEVVVTEYHEDGSIREHVIPHEQIEDLDEGERRRFVSDALPFELVLTDFMRNARPYAVAADPHGGSGVGVGLEEIAPHAEKAEWNMAGITAQVVPPRGGTREQIALWGNQRHPARVHVKEGRYDIDLRHKRWELPFRIRLDDFQVEQHPGTSMARRYSSFVTQTHDAEDIDDARVHITMNEPLRHNGYTLYQSGWGPQEARPGQPLYSSFSVVRNPTDRVPIVACVIIFAGLLVRFGQRILRHIEAQGRRAGR
jgi:hypothetical protein